jgi:hypothetical protein
VAKNNYSVGILLIGIAIVLLLGKLGVFAFIGRLFWPLLVLAVGALLHYLYFGRVLPAGVLVPGGMLIVYSLMFLWCNLFGWHSMAYVWPGFIFGAAVGLYELQLFERMRNGGVWTASVILAVISVLFFAFTFLFAIGIYAIALILIAAGIFLVFRRRRSW